MERNRTEITSDFSEYSFRVKIVVIKIVSSQIEKIV